MGLNKSLLLLLLLALFNGAWSNDDEEDAAYEGDDMDEDMGDDGLLEEDDLEESVLIGPHPDIRTYYVMPDYSEPSVPFGKTIDILAAVVNTGDKEFNITGVSGSINSPFDFSYYVQNFSRLEMNTLIKPNEQMSVLYSFQPDKNLEAMDFQLCINVFYEDQDSERYMTTFYNETTTFYEPVSELDAKTIFQFVLYATVAALLLLIVFRTTAATKTKPVPKKKTAESDGATENEWLDGIVNVNAAKKKAVKSPSGAKSPKKGSKKL